jgi:flavorubredoxin
MPGSVKFEYDPEKNIVFTEDEGEIKTKEEVDEFFEEYRKYFEKLGKKVYMISHIDNLLVRGTIAEYYGEKARATIGEYILGFTRWGINDWARMTVRTTSLKAKMTANIYDTREAAIEALEKRRKK